VVGDNIEAAKGAVGVALNEAIASENPATADVGDPQSTLTQWAGVTNTR